MFLDEKKYCESGEKMTQDERIEIYEKRNYIVSKANEIIQKSRYELSLSEQRTIAYICSKIKPITNSANNIPWQLEYTFDIQEYRKVCGLDNNGRIYEEIKVLLKELSNKTMWIKLADGTETTVKWIVKVWANKRSGKVKVRLDEDLAPYLFELQERFTAYGLINILAMKSQYSIRLYEIFKSYAFRKKILFDLNDLKKYLAVNEVKSYERFPDFRRKVLDIALKEINEYTDIVVEYDTITKGRKVIKINFRIQTKDIHGKWLAYQKVNDTIGIPE